MNDRFEEMPFPCNSHKKEKRLRLTRKNPANKSLV